jgi:hypothetical protein
MGMQAKKGVFTMKDLLELIILPAMSIYMILIIIIFCDLRWPGSVPYFSKGRLPGLGSTSFPFYNLYIWLKVVNKPLWWLIFLVLPFINVFHPAADGGGNPEMLPQKRPG